MLVCHFGGSDTIGEVENGRYGVCIGCLSSATDVCAGFQTICRVDGPGIEFACFESEAASIGQTVVFVDSVTGGCRIYNSKSIGSFTGFEVVGSFGLGLDDGGTGSYDGDNTGGGVDCSDIHVGRRVYGSSIGGIAEFVCGNGFTELDGDGILLKLQTGGVLSGKSLVGGDGQGVKAELTGLCSTVCTESSLITYGESNGVGRTCPRAASGSFRNFAYRRSKVGLAIETFLGNSKVDGGDIDTCGGGNRHRTFCIKAKVACGVISRSCLTFILVSSECKALGCEARHIGRSHILHRDGVVSGKCRSTGENYSSEAE